MDLRTIFNCIGFVALNARIVKDVGGSGRGIFKGRCTIPVFAWRA
jgi:hypothetical protein